MVSGDSTGAVQLWDSQHGTLLQAFHQHKADVLSVAASSDGNMVFATGIDTQVRHLHQANILSVAAFSDRNMLYAIGLTMF